MAPQLTKQKTFVKKKKKSNILEYNTLLNSYNILKIKKKYSMNNGKIKWNQKLESFK